jgi:hypothetical protein
VTVAQVTEIVMPGLSIAMEEGTIRATASSRSRVGRPRRSRATIESSRAADASRFLTDVRDRLEAPLSLVV